MIKKYFALSVIAASVALAGCSDDDDDPAPVVTAPAATPGEGDTALDFVVNSEDHDVLEAAVVAAGLADTLDDPGSVFTVFAPNDAAFQTFTDTTDETAAITAVEALPVEALTRVLQYHVVSGAVASADLTDGQSIQTLLTDGTLTASVGTDETVSYALVDSAGNTVSIITPDQSTVPEQGIVHVIDAVLTPPVAQEPDPDPDPEPDPNTTNTGSTGTAGTALFAGGYSIFNNAMATAFGNAVDEQAWTFFAPSDTVLQAAGLTEADLTGAILQEHISSQGAFDEVALAGGVIPGTTIPLQPATPDTEDEYTIGDNGSGGVTVNGFEVELLATGDNGSKVYSIAGILPGS